jgi:hypothetical protein
MDKLTLDGVNNFALTTDALLFMQNATEQVEKLGLISSEAAIISGCTVTAGVAAPGYVIIGGKVMPFEGGAEMTYVKVVESTVTVTVDTASRIQKTYKAVFTSTFSLGIRNWALLKKNRLESRRMSVYMIDGTVAGSLKYGTVHLSMNHLSLNIAFSTHGTGSAGQRFIFTGFSGLDIYTAPAIYIPVYYTAPAQGGAWDVLKLVLSPLTFELETALTGGMEVDLYINGTINLD